MVVNLSEYVRINPIIIEGIVENTIDMITRRCSFEEGKVGLR